MALDPECLSSEEGGVGCLWHHGDDADDFLLDEGVFLGDEGGEG